MTSLTAPGGIVTSVAQVDGSALPASMGCTIDSDGSNITVTLRNNHPTNSLDMVAITQDLGWTGGEINGVWVGRPGFRREVVDKWLFGPSNSGRWWLFGASYPTPGVCFPIVGGDDGNKAFCIGCNIEQYSMFFPQETGGTKQIVIAGKQKIFNGNGVGGDDRYVSALDYLEPGETRVIKIWIRRSTPGAQPTTSQMLALAQPWIDWYRERFTVSRPPRVSGRIWAVSMAQGEASQNQNPPNPRQYNDFTSFMTFANDGSGRRVDKDSMFDVLDAALGAGQGGLDALKAKGFRQVLIWALSGLNRIWDYDPAFWHNRPSMATIASLNEWSARRGIKYGFWCGSTQRRVVGGYGTGNVYAAIPDDQSFEGANLQPTDPVFPLGTRRHPRWDPLAREFQNQNPIAAHAAGASLMGLDAAAQPVFSGPWVHEMHEQLRRATAGMSIVSESYSSILGQHLMGSYYFPIGVQWDNLRCPIKEILFGEGYQDWCQINYWADGYYDAGGANDAAFHDKILEIESKGHVASVACPLNVLQAMPAYAGPIYEDVDPFLNNRTSSRYSRSGHRAAP